MAKQQTKPPPLAQQVCPYEFRSNGRVGRIKYWKSTKVYATYFSYAGEGHPNTHSTFKNAWNYLNDEFARLDKDRANSLSQTPLDASVKTYGELERLLREQGGGATLREAVTYYLANHKRRKFKPMIFSDCATTFVQHQKTNGIRPPQIETLEKHFRRFAVGTSRGNPTPFGDRTVDSFETLEIAEWLGQQSGKKSGEPWGGKTKVNVLGSLVSLSIFARNTLKAIPTEGKTEFQNVPKPKLPQKGPVDIYLPEEYSALLATAVEKDIDLIPVLVLGGLEGLRPGECHAEGLDRPPFSWEEIDWPNNQLLVTWQKVRNRKTRPVPLHRAAALWLKPFRHLRGPIWLHREAHTKTRYLLRPI